jgi:hypothetical protein
MKPEAPQNHQPTHEEIAVCAYLIWENEGRPEGRDEEYWYQATVQLSLSRLHDGALEKQPEA